MSLRTKLVAALVAVATAATIAVALFSYRATEARLLYEIDESLDSAVHGMLERPRGAEARPPAGRDEDDATVELIAFQVVDGSGQVVSSPTGVVLPVSDGDAALASSAAPAKARYAEATVDGVPYRTLTVSLGDGLGAVQAARSLAETDRILDSLRNRTLVIVGLVVLGSALLGWLIARQITRRLVRLTTAAEEVADTGRLDVAVPVAGRDETARLGLAFDQMLGALAASRESQQQLVQDAGHELRTPLTSLRTNISVLRQIDRLPADQQARLIDDLDGEARELTELVNELIELATDQRDDEPADQVALGPLVREVADRTIRRTNRRVLVDADDSAVDGRPRALARAVANLVDNAAKFDEGGREPIEVVVRRGRIEVRDRGPGIDEADLPHLFDRFYRSVSARSRPGSGLGLAIVRAVAEAHGGTVFATAREGGGAVVGFTVPLPPDDSADPDGTGSNPSLT